MTHFNQTPLRKAEFIKPPNLIKVKVGSGGLSDQIIEKAQKILTEDNTDFKPIAESYLGAIRTSLELAQSGNQMSDEAIIASILYPAVQLKANGGMFNFPVITTIADKLVQFLEVIKRPDLEAIEIITGFHTAIKAVLVGNLKGEITQSSEELIMALNDACVRYFSKNQEDLYDD